MTVQQAVKKYKLEPVNTYTAKIKAQELNVDEVLYMNVQKNKYAYIIRDGSRGLMLYKDEKSLYTKLYKGLKMICLDVVIATDVNLPLYLGLGKGVSRGYGVIYPPTSHILGV